MNKQRDDLAVDISRVIQAVLRCSSGFIWTEESVRVARSLVSVPKLDAAFVEAVHSMFREELGEVSSYVANEYNTYDGNADAIEAYKVEDRVGYYLVICGFYPVATLNYRGPKLPEKIKKMTYLQEYEELNLMNPYLQDYNTALHEKPDIPTKTLVRVETHMKNLSIKLEPLLASYGYRFLPLEAEAFQQSIRTGLFSREKALNFLFWVGDPYD